MRKSDFDDLIKILACPNCYGDLLPEEINSGDEVLSGRLRCSGCAACYPIQESVFFLIVPDASWKCVLQEVVSWESYELEQDFLKKTGRISEGISKAEEYHLEHESDREAKFEEMFSLVQIGEGIRACEVSAFECKQALFIARKAVDVVVTDAWLEPMLSGSPKEGRFIPKICCNAERMPFKSNSFDLTYVRTSIHHYEHPVAAIREMGRITSPGGKVVIINEPSKPLFSKSSAQKAAGEDPAFLLGMNEPPPISLRISLPCSLRD